MSMFKRHTIRNLFFLLVGAISLLELVSVKAYAENLAKNVLAEHVTSVGFAPPEYLGIYKLQLLRTGLVLSIDNKNKTELIAKLSPEILKKIILGIDQIKNSELSKPEGPICMDAPFQRIQIRQSNGVNMTIWKQESCLEFTTMDSAANRVARIMTNLERLSSQARSFEK